MSTTSGIERLALSGARAHMGADRGAKGRRWGWWYIFEHRLLNMRAYAWSIAMSSVGNPLFYLFALGVGLGALVDANSGSRGIDGVAYITFVGPALLASAAITSAFEESAFPVMSGFKWSREFFAMNATVIGSGQILGGVLLACGFRVCVTVAAYWALLVAFGALPSAFSALSILAALLGGLAFATLIMAFAASLEDDEGYFALIGRFVIAPMFLFSGTFYPLEQLPLALQLVGWISPLWHATELGRWAAYGHEQSLLIAAIHVVYLATLAGLGLVLARGLFARRLSR